ncbi:MULTISPECIES: hypothetical protein [Mycolicibacterium]|uniref:hypothetical protein n=1 Tax=Mycolicibacterium TaxID=1866885 RepID=UPI001F3767E0|nr:MULTISPECIES: hypothetical protein [Mycolicibacterium]
MNAISPSLGQPTRSEIENWDTSDLDSAASYWKTSAIESEDAFEQHQRNVAAPGGTDWEGDAKDAAVDRVTADVAVVRSQAGVVREAARIAENGSVDIKAAQRKALEAISEAESDGFRVGEDLSVTDVRRVDIDTMAARQTAAREHAENIRWTAEQLSQTDHLVGQRLESKAGELDGIQFGGRSDDTQVSMFGRDDETDVKEDVEGEPKASPGALPGEPGGPEFVIAPPTKPKLEWDEGFEYGSAKPTWQDYVKRMEWLAKLAGGRMIRSDLDDATQMYRHYWDNNGEPIEFDYEEAYQEDPGIRKNVDGQIARAQQGAEELIRAGNTSFSMTGDPVPSEAYPTTENWQKAIGGYQQWSSADVQVEGNKVTMTVTVHAEDHYNFNRGQADIATGAADNENGRFTELGWAKPFDSHGEITRTITWELGSAPTQAGEGSPQFNPGREDRADGRGSPGGVEWPDNNRNTGVSVP